MSRKGGQYERELCRDLSLWLSYGSDDDCLWRTSQSGGRATQRAKSGKKTEGHTGDLSATNKIGRKFLKRFAVEVKRGYGWMSIVDVFDNPKKKRKSKKGKRRPTYRQWFRQAERSMEQSNARSWMVIHRRDRRDALVWIPGETWQDYMLFEHITNYMTYIRADVHVVGFRLDWLLALDPKIFD
jgi:hypothetical protein